MTYGQDSPDANYFDDIPEENAQSTEQSTQPTFDPNKFVPVEKYSALEQQFQQAQPKLQTLDRLAEVFNPQTPQYTPEQIAEFQRLQQIARATVNPELQKIQQDQEVIINQTLDSNAKALGFQDRFEQEDWYFVARRGLLNKANAGDQQARHTVSMMENLYNSGRLVELQSYAMQNFDYLDQHAGKLSVGKVRTQQIGHGFNNSPFKTDADPMAVLKEAEQYRWTDPAKHSELLKKAHSLAAGQGLLPQI